MTKSEIINSFNSISPSNSYSKNGNLFEKVIQYRSYKSLINRLKNPIKLTKMSFIEEFKLKYLMMPQLQVSKMNIFPIQKLK